MSDRDVEAVLAEIIRAHLPRSVRIRDTRRVPGRGIASTLRTRDACRGCEWIGDDHAVHVAGVLRAALASQPAQLGDGVAEAVAQERERIAAAIEVRGRLSSARGAPAIGSVYEDAARIARTTTEDADHG